MARPAPALRGIVRTNLWVSALGAAPPQGTGCLWGRRVYISQLLVSPSVGIRAQDREAGFQLGGQPWGDPRERAWRSAITACRRTVTRQVPDPGLSCKSWAARQRVLVTIETNSEVSTRSAGHGRGSSSGGQENSGHWLWGHREDECQLHLVIVASWAHCSATGTSGPLTKWGQ